MGSQHAAKVIARNTAYVLAAQFALRGLSILFNIFIVRQLGDQGFGQYSTILAWTGIFSFIGDMGITQYMSREIARDREKVLSLFWDVAALRLILAVITIAITVAGAMVASYSSEMVIAIAILSSTYFIQAILTPLQGIIAGYERLDILSIYTVLGQLIFLASATIFLLIQPKYLWLVIAAWVNLPVLMFLCVRVVLRQNMRPPAFSLNPARWISLLRFGLPFAFIQVSLTFAFRFDTLILERHFADDVVGWYNAAYTLTRSLLIFTSAFVIALVPTLAREHAQDPSSIRPWYFRSVKFIALIGLPIAAGVMILSGKIIPFLYGRDFAPAILALAILIWDTPLLMYTSICGNFTTAMTLEKRAAMVYGAEAVFNILLNLVLIPRFGYLGASVVTVATELVGAILFYRMFRREFGPGLGGSAMLRMFLAMTLMGVLVYLSRELNIFLVTIGGAALYVFCVWFMRVLTPDELDLLASLARRLKAKILRGTPTQSAR
jgi:O-antigen/teichoic acid export membrane protein